MRLVVAMGALVLGLAACEPVGLHSAAEVPEILDGLAADGWGLTEDFAPSGECPRYSDPVETAELSTSLAREVSGLAASRSWPGVLWGHNDSGRGEDLFAFSADDGAHLGAVHLVGADNEDWEDMAIGPGPVEGVDYLYVADTGDNDRERGSVRLYRFAEPELPLEPEVEDITDVEVIDVVYGDEEAHDAEALLVDPVGGDVFIVTKSQPGDRRTRVFFVEAPLVDGERRQAHLLLDDHEAEDLDGRVVAGDVSLAGDQVVLYFRNGDARLWFRPGWLPLWTAFLFEPCEVPRPGGQHEAVAFDPETDDLLTVPEGKEPPIYRIALEPDPRW